MCGGVRASQRLTELLKHTQNMAQRLNAADSRHLWGLGLEDAGGGSPKQIPPTMMAMPLYGSNLFPKSPPAYERNRPYLGKQGANQETN